MQQQQMTVRE